jgi:hypothetical protein
MGMNERRKLLVVEAAPRKLRITVDVTPDEIAG